MDEKKLLLRPGEVGEALGVCRSTAYSLIADGTIPSIRLKGATGAVRVPVDSLRLWVAAQIRDKVEGAGR